MRRSQKCIPITLCSAQGESAVCACGISISLVVAVTQVLLLALLGGEINEFVVSISAKKNASVLALPCALRSRGGSPAKG